MDDTIDNAASQFGKMQDPRNGSGQLSGAAILGAQIAAQDGYLRREAIQCALAIGGERDCAKVLADARAVLGFLRGTEDQQPATQPA